MVSSRCDGGIAGDIVVASSCDWGGTSPPCSRHERFGHVPERDDSDVLLTPLHRANMRAIDAHLVRQSSLAEASFFPKKL